MAGGSRLGAAGPFCLNEKIPPFLLSDDVMSVPGNRDGAHDCVAATPQLAAGRLDYLPLGQQFVRLPICSPLVRTSLPHDPTHHAADFAFERDFDRQPATGGFLTEEELGMTDCTHPDGPFPDKNPDEDELVWDLLWSVREGLPEEEVLTVEGVDWTDSQGIYDAVFAKSQWDRPPRKFSHARIRYRDDFRNPSQSVDFWAPRALMPPKVLAGDAPDALPWLEERCGRDGLPHHATESVRLYALDEAARLLLELNFGTEIFLLSRLYYSELHEPLLLREVLLSTDHYLTYELHLEWERRVKEGLL